MLFGRSREFLCVRLYLTFVLAGYFALPATAAQSIVPKPSSQPQSDLTIPPGTILPTRVNHSFSSNNAKPGQMVSARIMQDVPLPNGQKIPAGSKLAGKIISVQPAANGAKAKVELRLDTLFMHRQSFPVVTSLRAIAGFMQVQEAQTPEYTPGYGTPYRWVPTQQIGGDEVYGVGGPVTNTKGERVGSGVYDGVLVHIRANSDSHCRGPFDEEDRLQALWVFSADACGVYGMEHLEIAHAGKTDPIGVIILAADSQDLKVHEGDALLLRVR